MNKVKIGVFGGYRGYTIIEQIIASPDAELIAVCDKHHPILDKIKKHAEENDLSVALYQDFDDFIQHDMDAVVLANYSGRAYAEFVSQGTGLL